MFFSDIAAKMSTAEDRKPSVMSLDRARQRAQRMAHDLADGRRGSDCGPGSNGHNGAIQQPVRTTFIDEWCALYGLDVTTSDYLYNSGIKTGDDLLSLYVMDINKSGLNFETKCLLRGAILQYRQSRKTADKELSKRGVNVVECQPPKRDYQTLWKKQASKVKTMDTVVMAMLKPEEREKIRELRRRLHTKRSISGGSLYERIMQQRMGNSQDNSSNDSISIDSGSSISADSADRRRSSPDVSTNEDDESLMDEIIKEVSMSDKENPRESPAERIADPPKDVRVIADPPKDVRVEPATEKSLENKLENMLRDIGDIGKVQINDSSSRLSPEESALQTENALKKLEDELFTEEELAMVGRTKSKKVSPLSESPEVHFTEEELELVNSIAGE